MVVLAVVERSISGMDSSSERRSWCMSFCSRGESFGMFRLVRFWRLVLRDVVPWDSSSDISIYSILG